MLPELSERSGLRAESLSLIKGDRNFVYQGPASQGEIVFKVIVSEKPTHSFLPGELDWMAHLHANGVRVPRPFMSRAGGLIESVAVDGRAFRACCYQKIDGPLWYEAADQDAHVTAVGQLAGKMHAVSADYVPSMAFGVPLGDYQNPGSREFMTHMFVEKPSGQRFTA